MLLFLDPCLNGAECIDKINAHECHCVAGFYGEKCEKNIYECDTKPCLNNGTCFDMVNVSMILTCLNILWKMY